MSLEIQKLQCERGGKLVVDVATLKVAAGEVVGILGANGAGKSTLLCTIALLEDFNGGKIEILGEDVGYGDKLRLRRQMALVMQKAHLLDCTVLENAAAGLIFRGIDKNKAHAEAKKWLSLFGVDHLAQRNGKQLSGGEAQRVSLARALACDPKILLLDEPFSQLDEPSRKSLLSELGAILRKRKQTTLFVTHSREEILQLATRVVILAQGRILQEGEVSQVFSAPACPETAAFVGMDSFYTGIVAHRDEELATIEAGGFSFLAVTKAPLAARVHLCVHPGDVVLAKINVSVSEETLAADGSEREKKQELRSSSRNRLACTVHELEPQDGITQVTLRPRESQKGPYLKAVITRHAERELELSAGVNVDALVKATALHAFEGSPSEAQQSLPGESKISPEELTS